ncbi:cation diffusion facilitator family transporter [Profundibacterium mesophilum]|uniref:Cation efflux system protein n=1 Tax=Profundibacterium mesophilum KAUST100406-0324 TaxID=1037889 RepID=A0A921NSH1_9RHOB|nr:cation diffusion facilitator family transporter [Profundibacterium mesophilum]KAF0677165.1 Cation efflux system protein [Profundibacterium mesophilum KAUST100406-0324]
MPHDHGHAHMDPASGDRRVSIAIWANALLTVAQIIGGILSGSLALVADALHNLSDMASLVIAFVARKIARRPADARMTFGYGRIEIVAALINYTTLILVGVYLVYEGAMRLIEPTGVAGWTVVIIGAVALAVDALTAWLTWSMQKGSVNMRALFVHNLSDALASVAVIVGGVLILRYDMRWVDPAITILIALYILYLALTEIGGPIRTLMLGSPPDMDARAVVRAMTEVSGVADVHHVHLWQMQEHAVALDCHVVLNEEGWSRIEPVKAEIKERLRAEFGITWSSLEFETIHRAHQGADLFGHGSHGGHEDARDAGP